MQQKSDIEILSHNIKALRIIAKLSPEDMATLLRISPSALANLENGFLPPDLECDFLFHIHRRFGICPAEMFTQEIVCPDSYQ